MGPAGQQGATGERGLRGGTGLRGEKGERGLKGAKGYRGLRGYKGQKGQKGMTGPRGPPGLMGPPGVNGSQLSPLGSLNNPAISCRDLYYDARQSGYYWIKTAIVGNEPVRVYCDMERACCRNTSSGWMRVANLDMTDPTQQCPHGFKLITRTQQPRRTCGRPDGHSHGCVSTTFPVHEIQYSRVCGRIVGYQIGATAAFYHGWLGINSYYIDGISLTHGRSPRQHIWSFAGAVGEQHSHSIYLCPCTRSRSGAPRLPSFVGNDYFCDTASRGSAFNHGHFYANDPLWDGQGCGGYQYLLWVQQSTMVLQATFSADY